jgi:hypothetical protein
MDSLLSLSLDLQILLVAGFLAYKTSTIGKANFDRSEDFLLKVLTYGVIGQSLMSLASTLAASAGFAWAWSPSDAVVARGFGVLISAIISAIVWRSWLSRYYSALMSFLKVYNDDHEPSVWNSITSAKTQWDCVLIHLENGKILETHFPKLDSKRPLPGIRLNDDGVALYVTAIHQLDGERVEFDQGQNGGFETITYVPRGQIRQMDVSWR